MGGIFINYRRHPDRNDAAQDLRDQLATRFGDARVFLDVASMNPGERYPNRLRRHLTRADAVIALVHPDWVRDLRAPSADWVQYELREAFAQGKRIIPVLVDGAAMPSATDLPKPLRDFANLQAYTGSAEGLADVIAAFTSRPALVRPTPVRPWTGVVAIGLAVVAFALAVALAPVQAIYLSLFATVVLVAVVIAVGVVALARRPLNSGERLVHDFHPTRYYLWVGLPAGTLMVAITVAVVFSSPVQPALRPFLIFIACVAIMLLVFLVIRQYRDERHREDNWPQRLPEPVRAAPVRRELDRLRRKAPGNPDRARWQVQHLENAADVLARDAGRGRWAWLTADVPVALCCYAVWASAGVGLMTSAALPTMRFLAPVVILLVTVVLAVLTLEMAFRRQRWVRRQVADEVHDEVQRFLDGN